MDDDNLIAEGPTVALASVAAVTMWLAGLALVLLELFGVIETGDLGVVLALGGSLLMVRTYFARMEERERAAFELGLRMAGPRT